MRVVPGIAMICITKSNQTGDIEMTTQNQIKEKNQNMTASGGWTVGLFLIIVGILALLARFVDMPGPLFFAGLSSLFLIWGMASRQTGLLIPGGILAGIAAGAALVEGPYQSLSEPAKGGVFLLAFAAGWVLISLLSFYTEGIRNWSYWPLFPAAGLLLLGGTLVSGELGLKALEVTGQGWPVALIAIGLYLVLRRKSSQVSQ
jgi:hypothetical protein